MWNVNETSVDLFLQQSAVSGAGRTLQEANVTYSILIEDLQQEIESENPPQDEIEQLQNRKGKWIYRVYTVDQHKHTSYTNISFLSALVATNTK